MCWVYAEMRRVLKFGGTSVKDAAMFHRVGEIVSRYPGERVVVLSAMAGITDKLVEIASCRFSEKEVEMVLSDIRKRHESVIESISSASIAEDVRNRFTARFEMLRTLCRGICLVKDITPRTRDLVLSYGERFSVLLLEGVLNDLGVKGAALEADQIGMVTDGVYGSATPCLDRIEEAFACSILPRLRQGEVPIITGFFGVDSQGNTTIFGRGGSDFSAGIVAYAIDADLCEIWTDVDGFMSADPRIVPQARVISKMDYSESAELAYFGAKVLHPRTVEPVRKKGIPILIKNTMRPDAPGTMICGNGRTNGEKRLVRAVASKGGLSIVKIYSPEMAYQSEFVSKVLGALERNGVNTYAVSTALSTFSFLVDGSKIDLVHEAIRRLTGVIIEKVVILDRISLICIVGERMSEPGVAAKVFTTVASTGTSIIMISEGASDVALNFAISQEREVDVLREIHKVYIEAEGDQ